MDSSNTQDNVCSICQLAVKEVVTVKSDDNVELELCPNCIKAQCTPGNCKCPKEE